LNGLLPGYSGWLYFDRAPVFREGTKRLEMSGLVGEQDDGAIPGCHPSNEGYQDGDLPTDRLAGGKHHAGREADQEIPSFLERAIRT
jgi:hypothetical protein